MVNLRRLPRAPEIALSTLGFGGAALGNVLRAVSDADAQGALQAALSGGVTYVDTAPYYGYGLSERRIGAFLARWRGPAPVLSSKVGRLLARRAPGQPQDFVDVDPSLIARYDYSRAGALAAFEASLDRLGVERVDILLIHDVGAYNHGPDAHEAILRETLDGALPALAELKAQGRIGAYGIGVNEEAVCLEIMAHADLDVIMLAGRYTLLEQGPAARLLPEAARRGIALAIAGPFNSGLLATPDRPGDTYEYAAVPPAVMDRARRIYDVCASHGVDVGAAALRFPLGHTAVASVVAGMRDAAEAQANLIRWRAEIPPGLWSDLRAEGLIAQEAKTP